MTLIMAMKWQLNGKEALVFSSDSKATIGPVSYETKKVHLIHYNETPIAVAAGSGDAALIKQVYRIFDRVLLNFAKERWDGRVPTFEEFEDAVRDIEKILISRFNEIRSEGISPDLSMVLGSVDVNGKASLYEFDSRGVAEPMHDTPGFAIIGKGFVTGANLLLRLLDYSSDNSYLYDIGMLTTFIIDVVSEIDPDVGPFVGESFLMRVEDGKVLLGPLTSEALNTYKEKTKLRKQIFHKLWILMDEIEEKEVMKFIDAERKKLEEDEET